MKGVALGIEPTLRLIDVAHELPPQDVVHAARTLVASLPMFPAGTVHVVVVDPGVGTARAAIAFEAGGQCFVGPDNGVFALVVERLGDVGPVHRIEEHPLLAPLTSATFEGRDVFAPTGAGIASGRLALRDVGPAWTLSPLAMRSPTWSDDGAAHGEIVSVDHFGNLISNLSQGDVSRVAGDRYVAIEGRELPLSRTYADVAHGQVLALIGSDGWLEIAVRDGSAARVLGLASGARVVVRAGSAVSSPR